MQGSVLVLSACLALVLGSCVNNCNSHGTCVSNSCVCDVGYGGSDCSIWDQAITSGSPVTGHVNTFQWKYYHIALPNGARSLNIQVNQTSQYGDIDLYVGKDSYPDTSNYYYKDQGTSLNIVAALPNVASGTWYIGLYGYWSADYVIEVVAELSCAVDCGSHGYCSGTACACYIPYAGEDCNIYDLAIASGAEYHGHVATGSWMYYHIGAEHEDNMYITLSQVDGSYDVDLYVKLNDRPTTRSFTYLNATTSPVTVMVLTGLAEGNWEIGIYGYRGGDYTLEVIVSGQSSNLCTNNCAAHGTCTGTACNCYPNFSGSGCEIYDPRVNLGDVYTGQVVTGTWNYWHTQYFTTSSLYVNVTQTTGGDCDLYIRSGQNPTRFVYQFADLGVADSYTVVIPNAGNDTWYLGVYGWTTCSYRLVVDTLEECQCVSSFHGHCAESSSQCTCTLGYAGPTCAQTSVPILSGQVLNGQAVLPGNWQYYYFVTSSMGVSITMVESNSIGSLWLLVSLEGYPDGQNFDYHDISNSDFHEVHIVWYEPPVVHFYFISVVPSTLIDTNTPIGYSITVYGTPF